MNKNDFSYYTFEVGRYLPNYLDNRKTFTPYKPETKKLVWNVFHYDFNNKKVTPINLFEFNWVFLVDGLLYAKKHYANDFIKFANHIRTELQCEYWSRSEYEVIVSGWIGTGFKEEDINEFKKEIEEQKQEGCPFPRVFAYDDTSYKLDVYTQVMLNWDRFIDYVWNNKRLITKKKLGLE